MEFIKCFDTVCPRRSYPFYINKFLYKMGNYTYYTWTYSTLNPMPRCADSYTEEETADLFTMLEKVAKYQCFTDIVAEGCANLA